MDERLLLWIDTELKKGRDPGAIAESILRNGFNLETIKPYLVQIFGSLDKANYAMEHRDTKIVHTVITSVERPVIVIETSGSKVENTTAVLEKTVAVELIDLKLAAILKEALIKKADKNLVGSIPTERIQKIAKTVWIALLAWQGLLHLEKLLR